MRNGNFRKSVYAIILAFKSWIGLADSKQCLERSPNVRLMVTVTADAVRRSALPRSMSLNGIMYAVNCVTQLGA